MKVALDAMGSDNAPRVEVDGAIAAVEESPELEVALVGQEQMVASARGQMPDRISLVSAAQTVGMHESPYEVVKRKRDSSMAICMNLLKTGEVNAMVSAGNTGAVMAYALTTLGVIPGVHRPTLGVVFPTSRGSTLVLDVGANVDTKPLQLFQFALMGTTAAAYLFRKANPSVGILNIGREDSKGNDLTAAASKLLKESELNFTGNIEGNDLLQGAVDVAVCDGFVGNILLKYTEAMGEVLSTMLDGYLDSKSKYRMRRWLSKPVLHEFIDRLDYERQGGALMLGVNGTVICAHGRSTAQAIKNALHTATEAATGNLTEHIRERFARVEAAA